MKFETKTKEVYLSLKFVSNKRKVGFNDRLNNTHVVRFGIGAVPFSSLRPLRCELCIRSRLDPQWSGG